MNTSLNSLRSKVMTLANKLRKQGLSKSDALRTAWQTIKKESNFQPKSETKGIEFKAVDNMSTLEKVQEYKKVNQLVDELEKYMDTIKQSLITEMETQQVAELRVDIFKVRYIEVVANRFNTSDFKKTHTDLYNQYLKESRTKRFTIAC